MNIEWRGGEQVEVLVQERKSELDADEESIGGTKSKQSADVHFPKKKEYGFGDEGNGVDVEDDYEGRGEEAEDGKEEKNWEVEDRLRQGRASSEKEVEDNGRTAERDVGEEGREVEVIRGRKEGRASSVSALSVSGEKILAHRYGPRPHHPRGQLWMDMVAVFDEFAG